jgi:hypothetical protein
MIGEHVLDALGSYSQLDADDIAYRAWERENADGAVFYSDYHAAKFAVRHREWVENAYLSAIANFGDESGYAEVMIECMDRFLVTAFITATEQYLHSQLGIDRGEGCLTGERKEEICALVKSTPYEGVIR